MFYVYYTPACLDMWYLFFVEKLKTFLFQGVRSSRRPLSTSGQRYEGGRDYDIDNIVCHNCTMAIMIIILGVFSLPSSRV